MFPRVIFFDADGTLFNNFGAHLTAVKAMLQDLDRDDIDPGDFHRRWDSKMFPFHRHVERAHRFLPISQIMVTCIKLVLREHGINVDRKSINKYVTMTRSSFINYGRPFEDAPHALEDLRNRGYDLRIISNADMDLYKQLGRMSLRSFFKRGITSFEARSYKPLRTIFFKALRIADCTPEEAAMVGDSVEYDIVGAGKVGMTTILIDRSKKCCDSRRTAIRNDGPDYVVSDLREISGRIDMEHRRTS